MTTKKFNICDVLSVTTGALLSDRHMDGVYEIMGHITGNTGISTIGLASSTEAARNFLEEKMPWVKEVKFPKLAEGLTNEERREFVDRFIKEAAGKYGEYHQVPQMPGDQRPDTSLKGDLNYVAKIQPPGPT